MAKGRPPDRRSLTGSKSLDRTLVTTVTGTKELERQFQKLEYRVRQVAVNKAARKAAQLVEADAKALVQVDTGSLQESIKVKRREYRSAHKGGWSVATGANLVLGGRLRFYGKFLEFGTEHIPKVGSKDKFAFLRPAFWGNQRRIEILYRRELRAELAKIKGRK